MEKLLIIGSCVSRDAFNAQSSSRFAVADYVARSSLGSALEVKTFNDVTLGNIDSQFQRRMVQIDTEKLLSELIIKSEVDHILMDFIDERFDLYENPAGEICTLSNEMLLSGYREKIIQDRIIRSGSEDFLQRWIRGWRRLLDILDDKSVLNKLKLNRVLWASMQENGSTFLPNYPPSKIKAANEFLETLYSYAEKDLPAHQILKYKNNLFIGGCNHRWGVSPFHYIDKFYNAMTDMLSESFLPLQAMSTADLSPSGYIMENVEIDATLRWCEISVQEHAQVVVSAVLVGAHSVSERRALFTVDFGRGQFACPEEFSVSHDQNVGTYRYLNTGPGKHETKFKFSAPAGCLRFRIGIRSWWPEGTIMLESLHLNVAPYRKPIAMLSVDVEALPGRSEISHLHVDQLIFGRFAGGPPVGIERLCDLFEQFGAKATFFIDYSTIPIYGEKEIFKAANLLEQRGHDVQLHLHSEVLVRHMAWPHDVTRMPAFDSLDRGTALRCIEFGVQQFNRNTGRLPTIFRPGGMRHSKAMYDAVKDIGIQAVSAMYRRYEDNVWPLINYVPLFKMENDVVEMPLDIALDPLVCWDIFDAEIKRISGLREEYPTISLLLHSTSLLFRERTIGSAFTKYHRPHEEQLIKYLGSLSALCDFATYTDLLKRYQPTLSVPFTKVYLNLSNVSCDLPFQILPPKDETTQLKKIKDINLTIRLPSFKRDFNKNLLALLPPTNLPVRLAPGQRLDAVFSFDSDCQDDIGVAYILNGKKAHLQCNRARLQVGRHLEKILICIFRRHPQVERIVAESVLDNDSIQDYESKTEVRRTFVLDMPSDFEFYRNALISQQLRRDIEREERRVRELFPDIQFIFCSRQDITSEILSQAANLIEAHLLRKTSTTDRKLQSPLLQAADIVSSDNLYSERGVVYQLATNSGMRAAALCLFFGRECYFMAAGHDETCTNYSLGKILLYRVIQNLIGQGINTLHLGGGDFGYKSRFGAVETPLYSFEFFRPSGITTQLIDRVKCALAEGEQVSVLESDLGQSLEVILGKDFEQTLDVDFEGMVEVSELGLDHTASRYQATMGEAFFTLTDGIIVQPDDVFVDVGCGKGKILYYAARLGYNKCIGIDLSADLILQAKSNLEKMKLNADIELLQRNAATMDPKELACASVLYLYNPFTSDVLKSFLGLLVESQKISPRLIKVIYCNARYIEPFHRYGFNIVRDYEQGSQGWRFDRSVIFEHRPR